MCRLLPLRWSKVWNVPGCLQAAGHGGTQKMADRCRLKVVGRRNCITQNACNRQVLRWYQQVSHLSAPLSHPYRKLENASTSSFLPRTTDGWQTHLLCCRAPKQDRRVSRETDGSAERQTGQQRDSRTLGHASGNHLFYSSLSTGEYPGDILKFCISTDIWFDEQINQWATRIHQLEEENM